MTTAQHPALIEGARREYVTGWALSTSVLPAGYGAFMGLGVDWPLVLAFLAYAFVAAVVGARLCSRSWQWAKPDAPTRDVPVGFTRARDLVEVLTPLAMLALASATGSSAVTVMVVAAAIAQAVVGIAWTVNGFRTLPTGRRLSLLSTVVTSTVAALLGWLPTGYSWVWPVTWAAVVMSFMITFLICQRSLRRQQQRTRRR